MNLSRPIRRVLLALIALAAAAPAAAESAAGPWSTWGSWAPFGTTPKWDGQHLRLSTGFEVTSFGHGHTYAGPTIGLEAGKMWREGDLVYGVSGAVSYMRPFVSETNNSSFTEVTRDFAGAARFRLGYLVQPNFLLYATVGASALNETWRYPQFVGGGDDHRLSLRPEAGGGFEWAINDRTRIFGEITVRAPVR
jgi:opacity protein-like surface antigen